MSQLTLFPILNFPLIRPGDDLAALIVEGIHAQNESLLEGDILVIAQKVVSKSEGRLVNLSGVAPGAQALALAETTGKDPRVLEVILSDTNEVIRAFPGMLIVETQSGWICAHGGVDRSNIEPEADGEVLALLPVDSDASAQHIRSRLGELIGHMPPVLINDSHGRPWRFGTGGVCIGCAGMPPVWDQRGRPDLFGYELRGSEEGIADELCAAASLVMGQSDEGRPVVVVRGYRLPEGVEPAPARSVQRPKERDAFR